MSTQIGTVTLDRDMIFSNEYNYGLIVASVTNTLGGGVIIQEFSKAEKGRQIILVSSETQGLQLKSTVDALMALAGSGVYNTYLLTINSNSKVFSETVRFMHEVSDGAIKAEPFFARDGLHSDIIYYKLEINLMVI